MLEYTKCIICDLENCRIIFKKRDKFNISKEFYNVVECNKCGLKYINPRPDQWEIRKFYPPIYSWRKVLRADNPFIKLIRKMESFYRYHLLKTETQKLIKFTGINSGKILDIGCGAGDRLKIFSEFGFKALGIEPSSIADYAQDELKQKVFKGDIFSANFEENFFDIVTLYHVLEHTHNPHEVCSEIYRILKKGGYLIVQLPNTDCLQFKIFGKRWAAFDVPRDLYYFNISTLCTLLNKVGFKIIKIDHFMNFWHPPTIVISLFPNLDPQISWKKEEEGKNPIFQRLAWIFFTLSLSPFTYFESAIDKGAIVTLYAKK